MICDDDQVLAVSPDAACGWIWRLAVPCAATGWTTRTSPSSSQRAGRVCMSVSLLTALLAVSYGCAACHP